MVRRGAVKGKDVAHTFKNVERKEEERGEILPDQSK